MPNIYLTDDLVSSAICPDGKGQEIYWDHPISGSGKVRHGSIAGLGLRVTSQGNKSFVHAYWYNGKRRRKALGSPPVVTVASARLMIIAREREISAGESPDLIADPRKDHVLTVRDAINDYHAGHMIKLSQNYRFNFGLFVAAWHKPVSEHRTRRGKYIRKRYEDFGTKYADRKLASIKPLDIQQFLKQFESPYSHNGALSHVKALFGYAIRMQLVDMRNPCDPVRPVKIIRKRREYSLEQIALIGRYVFNPALEAVPAIETLEGKEKRDAALRKAWVVTANGQMTELCHFMGILFLTMARPSDVYHARFEHFDLDRLIWHKHNTKGIKLSRALYEYESRSVPIHPRVAAIVRTQQQLWPDSELVFPSHTDMTKPRDNFRKGLTKFRALPGVPDHFQMYDLKRIAISLMLTGQGVSREAVSHYVDHKGNLETTMIYDLGLVDPLRPVTDRLGALLEV